MGASAATAKTGGKMTKIAHLPFPICSDGGLVLYWFYDTNP